MPPDVAPPPTFQTRDQTYIEIFINTVLTYLYLYGWTIIAVVVFGALLWANLEPYVYNFFYGKKKGDLLDNLSSNKIEKLLSNHDKARERMQQAYDAKKLEKKSEKPKEGNVFESLASGSKNKPTEDKKKPAKKPFDKAEMSALLGQAAFDPPRYRPGANRYQSRGG